MSKVKMPDTTPHMIPETTNGPLTYVLDAPTRRMTAISSREVKMMRRMVLKVTMMATITKETLWRGRHPPHQVQSAEPVDDSLVFTIIDAIDDRRAGSGHCGRTGQKSRYASIFRGFFSFYGHSCRKWITAYFVETLKNERIVLPLALEIGREPDHLRYMSSKRLQAICLPSVEGQGYQIQKHFDQSRR